MKVIYIKQLRAFERSELFGMDEEYDPLLKTTQLPILLVLNYTYM